MSYLDDLQAELAVPAHLEVMGDTVIRMPASGETESVTGIWHEHPPSRDTEAGDRGMRTGILQVPTTQQVARGDQWRIKSEVWQLATKEWVGATRGGLRTLHLQRAEKVNTQKQSRGII